MLAPVSVIIPCFNCAQTIGRAVDSVMRQTLLPAEILLVNDASNDEGQTEAALNELLRRHQSALRFKVLSLPENCGPGGARNAGWQEADYPYLAFLDADDSWHPQKIEVQYRWMEQHPEVAISGHLSVMFNDAGAQLQFSQACHAAEITFRRMLFKNLLPMRTVMLRKEGINERFPGGRRYAEDYALWLALLIQGKHAMRIGLPLAHTYKREYGEAGLSANLWRMEQGELGVYFGLWRQECISLWMFILICLYSILKYIRRIFGAALVR